MTFFSFSGFFGRPLGRPLGTFFSFGAGAGLLSRMMTNATFSSSIGVHLTLDINDFALLKSSSNSLAVYFGETFLPSWRSQL